MRGLTYHGAYDIRYEEVDDPTILDSRDAIVKVDLCGICGSDLHIYHGQGFSSDLGFCVGHEAVGEIVEVGSHVQNRKVGDKVMISGAVGCGRCRSCIAGNVIACDNNGADCYGLRAALPGSQAEAVRVPAVDYNAAPIPEGITPEQALLMTDAAATAWFGARKANIVSGATVAVVGLGPIGLIAIESAFAMGAARVFAIDLVESRREVARSIGAETPDPTNAVDEISEATSGAMCDSVVEAVGVQATIDLALRLPRRRGHVSVIGVPQQFEPTFPMGRAFGGGLHFFIGTCSVPEEWPALVPLVRAGRIRPERYITDRLSLSEGPDAYERFDRREDGVMKVVFDLNA